MSKAYKKNLAKLVKRHDLSEKPNSMPEKSNNLKEEQAKMGIFPKISPNFH